MDGDDMYFFIYDEYNSFLHPDIKYLEVNGMCSMEENKDERNKIVYIKTSCVIKYLYGYQRRDVGLCW